MDGVMGTLQTKRREIYATQTLQAELIVITSSRSGWRLAALRAVYRESCDNRNLGAILCPKCPATGIACIDFKHRLGKFSGNVNVQGRSLAQIRGGGSAS